MRYFFLTGLFTGQVLPSLPGNYSFNRIGVSEEVFFGWMVVNGGAQHNFWRC